VSALTTAANAGDAPAGIDRDALFRESPHARMRRIVLGAAWALKPPRLYGLPALGRMWLADLASPARALPDPEAALASPAGLCGIVHDLSVPTLLEAYSRGLYPFAHVAPLKWWSPPERCIINVKDFHMPKRLRGRVRQARHRVTFDRDFEAVMKACAAPRENKWQVTWITPQMMHAYADLHDAGHAHSFEVWNRDGELVGGGYGVAVGGAFAIESQFTRESNTSKIGFAVLNWHLARWGFVLNDNKGPTRNVLEMGFRTVPRAEFLARLAEAVRLPGHVGRWSVETELPTVAQWFPGDVPTLAS
jgi:leucyl/phenylalanyl-tRNA--protein transferase